MKGAETTPPSAEPVLRVEGLRKAYGPVVALNGLDLIVERGQVIGLLGPNGAGKTTLVSIISGLRRADAGSVTLNGIDALAHPQRARAHLGLAPQDIGIYPSVTVRNNLQLFADLAGIPSRSITGEIDRISVALHLDDLLDRKSGEMSGGQKRRLHTAIACSATLRWSCSMNQRRVRMLRHDQRCWTSWPTWLGAVHP